MKPLLICPDERSEVSALAESAPLVNLCILGKPFIHHWLEHLANAGAKEIRILAVDRPDQVREIVESGARWGLRAEVIPESHELTCEEARRKYGDANPADALQEPNDIAIIDHLPGFPGQKLFESYSEYFAATQFLCSQNPGRMQIGAKEILPGIWIGKRTTVSPEARLYAPCWIGENVLIKSDAEIGPMAILENGVVVENAATISESWIGTQTFVGNLTQVQSSLAFGNSLVNFRRCSVAKVPDAFLLCALKDRNISISSGHFLGRVAALVVMLLTLPLAAITILKAMLQGNRALRPRRAAAPQIAAESVSSIAYFEFPNSNGWWRRWPQLWNVVRGEFTWIGNRPLTLIEAGELKNEFERLWLAAPIGLISQGDAEGCADLYSDEARAHASFYAAQVGFHLDVAIFFRALKRFVASNLSSAAAKENTPFKDPAAELGRAIIR